MNSDLLEVRSLLKSNLDFLENAKKIIKSTVNLSKLSEIDLVFERII